MTRLMIIKSSFKWLSCLITASGVVFLSACATPSSQQLANLDGNEISPDKLLPVDCLLPPKIKKLGSQMTYLEARRPTKSTAFECEIKGGEYVAYDRADFRTALKVWLEKAKTGDVQAQTYVGEIFEKGLGVTPDYQAAFQWYSRAAGQNHPAAQINLGYLYEKGLGVSKDPVKALNLYRQASGISESINYSSVLDDKADMIAADYHAALNAKDQEINQLRTSLELSKNQLTYNQSILREQNRKLGNIKNEILKKNQSIDQLTKLKNLQVSQERNIQSTQQKITLLKQNNADAALPVIEVIQPALLATRGGISLVASAIGQSQLIKGKISAPAGFEHAMINGKSINVDNSGVFETTLTIGNTTDVKIQAIDKRGKATQIVFQIVPEQIVENKIIRKRTVINRDSIGSVDFGKYYALVIGNDQYANYSNLKTAINDATQVGKILDGNYGVETTVLKNANRYTILSAINQLKSKLTKNDNLIIYYAGHGEIDKDTQQGYWLPVDAERDSSANWISNAAISDLLNTVAAKHVLIVADSCYSGSMSNSSTVRLNNKVKSSYVGKWLKAMAKTRSRTVLTSGGLEPVLDTGTNGHSVFANAFINELKKSEGVIDAYQLYLNINQKVSARAAAFGYNQIPGYAPIKHAGHAGGEFVLVGG